MDWMDPDYIAEMQVNLKCRNKAKKIRALINERKVDIVIATTEQKIQWLLDNIDNKTSRFEHLCTPLYLYKYDRSIYYSTPSTKELKISLKWRQIHKLNVGELVGRVDKLCVLITDTSCHISPDTYERLQDEAKNGT